MCYAHLCSNVVLLQRYTGPTGFCDGAGHFGFETHFAGRLGRWEGVIFEARPFYEASLRRCLQIAAPVDFRARAKMRGMSHDFRRLRARHKRGQKVGAMSTFLRPPVAGIFVGYASHFVGLARRSSRIGQCRKRHAIFREERGWLRWLRPAFLRHCLIFCAFSGVVFETLFDRCRDTFSAGVALKVRHLTCY